MTVNTVAPDSTQLDLPNASTTHEGVNNEAQMTPVARRVGTPDDIAQIVAWLASKDSKWITGQCIYASGGYRMYKYMCVNSAGDRVLKVSQRWLVSRCISCGVISSYQCCYNSEVEVRLSTWFEQTLSFIGELLSLTPIRHNLD